jgi:hypothetical protein
MGAFLFFVVGLASAAAVAVLSVRAALLAGRLAALRRRGVRTTGRVDSLRQVEDSEGNARERALVAFDVPGERTTWTETGDRRPGGARYRPGDEVRVVYDPEQPFRASVVHTDREPWPRRSAIVLVALAAVLLAGVAVAVAWWMVFYFAWTELRS